MVGRSWGCAWKVNAGSDCVIIYEVITFIYIFQLNLCRFFTSDKEAFCPALNSSLASANISLLACKIECCFGINCNNLNFPGRYMT